MKKIISFFLFLCLLLTLVSCNNGEKKETQTGETTEETKEPSYLDSLPKVDLGQDTFNVLIATQLQHFYDFDSPSADIVENAAYTRNMEIEEYYNTDIVYTAMDGNSSGANAFTAAISTSIMGGTSEAYDLVIGQNYYTLTLMSIGAWHNLKEANVTNWDAEWYHPNINNSGEINGRLYGASGSFVMSQLAYALGWYYNKTIYENYGFTDDLYQLVRDGEWTYAKFYEMVTSFKAVDNEDINSAVYGMLWFDHPILGLAVGMGLTFGEKNEDGVWNFDNFYNDRTEDIYGKLYDLFHTQQGGATCDETLFSSIPEASWFDHCLFVSNYVDGLQHADHLMKRDGLTIGVIMPPKYDEQQKDYYVHIMRNELYLIPSNADLETVATLVEALNYKTYELVYPEYWSKVIELRSADTAEDREMLQLMSQKLTSHFGIYYRQDLLALDTSFRDQIGAGQSPTFSGWWKSNSFRLGLELEDLYETYGGVVAEE